MATSDEHLDLKIVSFNMHGFYQGAPVMEDIIDKYNPDLFMLQEHWLTPANLCKFDEQFLDYFSVGSSAMSSRVEAGFLRGRPFGGVLIMIKDSLRKITKTVHCSDRYVIVKVGDCLFVNVYLPCVGSTDRRLICDNVVLEIGAWCSRFSDCKIIVGGDFNVDLDGSDIVARNVLTFADNYDLVRCDELFPNERCPTYVNIALNHESCIDYIIVSSDCLVTNFSVIDPDINFSDHLPLRADIKCLVSSICSKDKNSTHSGKRMIQRQLRWDQADLASYYFATGDQLSPLLARVDDEVLRYSDGEVADDDVCDFVDRFYCDLVDVLLSCAKNFVPERHKGFHKFWWNEDLSMLKEASVHSNQLWKAAGKPRQGPIFHKRQTTRMQYRRRIREGQRMSDEMYTNELHEALLRKDGSVFWKCWRSKFESSSKCIEVDGSVDEDVIAEKFVKHFSNCFSCNDENRSDILKDEYMRLRENYVGLPSSDHITFDTELVSKVVLNLHRGKAIDIDGLTSEHILFSHPVLPLILSHFFNLILRSRHVLIGFKRSYILPIPKPKDTRSKAMSCNDFRATAELLLALYYSRFLNIVFLRSFSQYLRLKTTSSV